MASINIRGAYLEVLADTVAIRPGDRALPVTRIMQGEPDEIYSLSDYRRRYALYKRDPDLQAMHASAPFLPIWDDHEVDNDYANDRSQDLDPVEAFLARRAAAYQAYYEHMPLPPGTFTGGPNMKIYGTHAMGSIAHIQLLDMRQYRDYHVCPRPTTPQETDLPRGNT